MKIDERLREAIASCGKSGNAVAKESGVAQPVISRFLNGNDIKLSAAVKLASYFELELQPKKSVKKNKN